VRKACGIIYTEFNHTPAQNLWRERLVPISIAYQYPRERCVWIKLNTENWAGTISIEL
jgi:hypothetical protein